MRFFTYLIVFTMICLVGVWWYTNTTSVSSPTEESPIIESSTNLPAPTALASIPLSTSKPETQPTKSNIATNQASSAPTSPTSNEQQSSMTAPSEQTHKSIAKPSTQNKERADSNDTEEIVEQHSDGPNNNNVDNTETNSDNAD